MLQLVLANNYKSFSPMNKTFRINLTLTVVLLCFVFLPVIWLQSSYVTSSHVPILNSGRHRNISHLKNQNENPNKVNFPQPTSQKYQRHSTTGPTIVAINVTDWKNTAIKTLTASQLIEYLLWTNQPSCQILQYFGGLMVSSATGVVSLDGQKAICLDSKVAPKPDRCLVYSFGINNEWSFDEAMELYGCKIFSFDPSMNVSNHNRSENIHFFQMALSDVDRNQWNKSLTIPSRTLFSIYSMLEPIHGTDVIIDYLKIDIETAEWHVLPQILESGMLDKVRQLSVEIHMDFQQEVKICCQQANIIHLLEDYGMIRFDSKPNVYSRINVHQSRSLRYEAYEISWYNSNVLHYSS